MFYENVKLNQDITNLSRRIADQNEALAIEVFALRKSAPLVDM